MKRTLKRELKVREIAKRETFNASVGYRKSALVFRGALSCIQVNISFLCRKKIGRR
jgi:hypothetical protein